MGVDVVSWSAEQRFSKSVSFPRPAVGAAAGSDQRITSQALSQTYRITSRCGLQSVL